MNVFKFNNVMIIFEAALVPHCLTTFNVSVIENRILKFPILLLNYLILFFSSVSFFSCILGLFLIVYTFIIVKSF